MRSLNSPVRTTSAAALALALLVGPPLAAQDPEPAPPPVQDEAGGGNDEETPPEEPPPIDFEHFIRPELGGGGAPTAEDELLELFGKVERGLLRVDGLLLDAAAGDASRLSEVGEAGLDDLLQEATPPPAGAGGSSGEDGVAGVLRRAESKGRGLQGDIDRMIELAQQMGGQCSSSGGSSGNPSSDSKSPLDGRPESRIDKTRSPSDPHSTDEPSDSENPQDPERSDDPARPDSPAARPPDSETGPARAPGEDREAWGELPIHVRDVFRAEGGPSMPPRYRDWIDAYYRRLNARSRD